MQVQEQIAGGTAAFQDLPDTVLLQIFQYLSTGERCQLMRVSRRWSRVLSDSSLWKHVDLLEFRIDLWSMRRILTNHLSSCLLTLKIQGFAYPDNSRRKTSLSDALLNELSACCPDLRVLHLYDCRTSDFLFASLPSSITCLEVVNSVWRPRWMRDKQSQLSNLQHLTLDMSLHVDDFDMEDIAFWKNLKYLSLRGCFRVGMDGVITIAQNLLQLECLTLCEIEINDCVVNHIVCNLKKLKELCIAESLSITDRAVATIAAGLPELNRLDISYCEHVTMVGLESLFASKISTLVVERLATLSEEQKQTLKNGFPANFVLMA